jgi:hypothetical protein
LKNWHVCAIFCYSKKGDHMSDSTTNGDRVHIFNENKMPLCRFSEFPPADWPFGHVGVPMEKADKANCSHCKYKLGFVKKK